MAQPSIAPAPGLTTPADPRSGQKTQFALFSDSWLELQAYVGAAIDLPITKGNFEEKYGTIGSSTTILDAIDAMKNVQAASTEFGNPKTLREALIKDPNILGSKEPPAEIYTHTVWLGQRVRTTALNLSTNFQEVVDDVQSLPSKEKVAALKEFLFDQASGPIAVSKQMSDEAGALIRKLGKFERKMNEYNQKLQAFTSGSSKMIQEVDTSIGALAQKIKELEGLRDEAYKAWRDFTIAAVTTAVGCLLIGALLAPFTAGASLAVGAIAGIATGVGLGVKAAQERGKYNEYCNQLDTQNQELMKKQKLRADLGDLNTQMQRIGPAMGKFLKSLQTVEGVWVSMNSDMLAISNSITPENVGESAFIVKLKANQAIEAWKDVGESAKQFTVESLIDYQSLAFGDQMPEPPADKRGLEKLAA
jgi:hypothetical protein